MSYNYCKGEGKYYPNCNECDFMPVACGGTRYVVSFRSFNGFAVVDMATGEDVKCWLSEADAIALCERLNREVTTVKVTNNEGEKSND